MVFEKLNRMFREVKEQVEPLFKQPSFFFYQNNYKVITVCIIYYKTLTSEFSILTNRIPGTCRGKVLT